MQAADETIRIAFHSIGDQYTAGVCAILGNVHVWDVAAGQVILESAGGSIRDKSGKKVDLSNYLGGEKIDLVLIAAAKGQHKEIADTLKER